MDNRRSGLAILEVMNVVGGSREGIHGHSHGTDFGRTKKGGHKLRRIRQHDQNAVASTNALRTQRVPRAIGKRCQFAAGYLTWFANDGRALRVRRCRRFQKMSRHVEIFRQFLVHKLF